MDNDISKILREVVETLDKVPTSRTNYEFENFVIETHPTPARQLVAVMLEIEALQASRIDISEKMAGSKTSEGEIMLLRRKLNEIEQRLSQLVEWYGKMDGSYREKTIANLENEEGDYWANYLGRKAALEMLTTGRTNTDTMDRMASLPIESFEEAVRLCVRYASLIKDTTQNVESAMGIEVPNLPTMRP